LSSVTSGDVIVLAIGDLRGDTQCATVTGISGTLGDTSYTAASGGEVSNIYNSFSNSACAYSAIYYATVTSGGSDTITVNLAHTPHLGLVIVAYDVGSALTPPTAVSGVCPSTGNCPTTIVASSLSVTANSLLATAAADCPDQNGDTLNIISGPSGVTSNYGPNQPEYVGYEIPSSSGSQSFQMTSNTASGGFGTSNPACWTVVGAQFVDPPPPPGWNTTASGQYDLALPAVTFHAFGYVSGIGSASFSPVIALTLLGSLGVAPAGRPGEKNRSRR
jgi:hypothetical protein